MGQNTTIRVNGAWIKYIAFYVQKHIAPWTVVITLLLVRDKPLGAPAFVKRVYCYYTCNSRGHKYVFTRISKIKMLSYIDSLSLQYSKQNVSVLIGVTQWSLKIFFTPGSSDFFGLNYYTSRLVSLLDVESLVISEETLKELGESALIGVRAEKEPHWIRYTSRTHYSDVIMSAMTS